MTERTVHEIEAWEESQRREMLRKPPLVDRLFMTLKRLAPELSDERRWKITAALIADIAAEKGIDLT